ncbi:MAG: hypothetical protein VXY44_02210, partial [Pseudomonadota bacterium]|nr:hypothetical protein [Pseudomonadota bacterium]
MPTLLQRDLARAAVKKARKEKKVSIGVLASVANISQSYASGILKGYRYKKQQDCPGKEAHWLNWLEHLDIPLHQVTSTPEQKAYRTKTLYLLEATERGGGAVGIKYGITQKCAKRRAIA